MTSNMAESSVSRAFRIIELLAETEGLGVRDVARSLGTGPSTSLRILKELVDTDFVERLDDGRYALSSRILRVSQRLLQRTNLPDIARPYLEMLSQSSGCTAFLGVPRSESVVYLVQERADVGLQLNIDIGTNRPMYCTGLGKAMLAFMKPETRMEIISKPLVKVTENTIVDKDALLLNLEESKIRGYAVDDEEIMVGIYCIAAPIHDMNGNVVGAISLSGPKILFTKVFAAEYSIKVMSCAKIISLKLGYEAK